MHKNILRIIVLILLMLAVLTVLTNVGVAHDASTQDAATHIQSNERTAGQVFKNIKVLNDLPQSQIYPVMRFMAASLGFQCGNCHVIRNGFIDAPLDDKPEKQTARQMIKMVIEINKTTFQGNTVVSCYTCHRGNRSPQGAPYLPLAIPSPPSSPAISSGKTPTLPSVDDVLNKYLDAIGGKAATGQIKNLVVKGTTTTALGLLVPYESEQAIPDKGHETFSLQNTGRSCAGDSRCEYERVIKGREGWLKSGAGVQELLGEQLGDQKLSFPLFSIVKLREQYSSFRLSGRDRIDDREVYVIAATRSDNRLERLYFDVENGLLRRRISYMRTLVGMIPQQVDFENYREVEGLKLPFTITMSFADRGSTPIVRQFTEIKFNVSVDESKFAKPQ